MGRKPDYNWDAIKRAFIGGEGSLFDMSREKTGQRHDPPYQSIRARAAASANPDGVTWEEQRKIFKQKLNKGIATPTSYELIKRTEQLVNASEAIGRHIEIAKSMQSSYVEIAKKLKQMRIIERMDFSTLSPVELSLLLQRLSSLILNATEIERKAMGISDPEQRLRIDASVHGTVDLSTMTEAELRRIAAGDA